MSKNLNRLAPLTGIVFVLVILVAIFASKTSPSAGASGAKVISFYSAHSSSQKFSDIMFVIGFAFFVLFAGAIHSSLRAESGATTTALVGAGIMAAGFGFLSVVDYALAAHPAQLTAATAQVLNTLDNDGYPMAAAGGLVFGLGAGFAILNSSPLPRWLGYVVIVLGILAATPLSLIGLLGLLVWTVIVSVTLSVRAGRVTAPRAAAVPASAV